VTAPLRVLIVDDAVIVRRLMMQALASDPAFEVVGVASDGRIALERIAARMPDVVTLDLDMPEMSGLATLREIRRRWPHLPVLIFTGMDQPGELEMEALALGALGVLPKQPHEGNMMNAIAWVREKLVPMLRQVAEALAAPPEAPAPARPRVAPVVPAPASATLPADPRADAPRPAGPPEVLAIGCSTGGPNALEEVLSHLPADFPLPILVVQHMPQGFTRLLAERLSRRTPFAAAEAEPGTMVEPGRVWIAPGDRHLVVQRAGTGFQLQTNREAPENSCRPAVDVLFRSVASAYGRRALAAVLTGMGQDGALGAQAIVAAGGQVLAQDEASSVVWGMPGAVVRAGLAAKVLPLAGLAEEIVQRARGGRVLAARP
jgi:two-component system, chemotaxis family, protein-glutamate methylesterase/glutaminase